MKSRFTVVVDNQAAEGLVAEHGFSLLIESGEQTILLDTGQKNALLPNMSALGIAPDTLTTLVLSHGHYDHTGGVADLLAMNRSLELYLHSGVFQPRYSLDGEQSVVVKMPLSSMDAIMHYPESRIHWLSQPAALASHVGLTGPVKRCCAFEDTGGHFFLDPDGNQPDTIRDDGALWVHGPKGLVVCLGCCHSGLVNTLRHISLRTGENRVAMIIGGLHLMHATSQRLEATVDGLQEFQVERIVACHCTGDKALAFLQESLPATEVIKGYAGMVLEI